MTGDPARSRSSSPRTRPPANVAQLATTDADARRTLVAGQQADVLYGAADYERLHMVGGPSGCWDSSCSTAPVRPTLTVRLLAVHACAPDSADPVEGHLGWLARAVRCGPTTSSGGVSRS